MGGEVQGKTRRVDVVQRRNFEGWGSWQAENRETLKVGGADRLRTEKL